MKGVRSLETGRKTPAPPRDANERLRRLIIPHPERLWDLFFAFEAGESLEGVAEITRIDPWFLDQIQQIVEMRAELKRFEISTVPVPALREAKRMGFSDLELAEIWGTSGEAVRARRLLDPFDGRNRPVMPGNASDHAAQRAPFIERSRPAVHPDT